MTTPDEYQYRSADAPWLEAELWPVLRSVLKETRPNPTRVIELGCGNGATANMLSEMGYEVTGVDPSESGIGAGSEAYAGPQLRVGSVYDDLVADHGRFPIVVSLEVIEHCYSPAKFARAVYELLEDNGIAIVSTPFHGYWKNLAISVLGRWDQHMNPLWEHGHIKQFSESTLAQLMAEHGLTVNDIRRVGRVPPLAKSMVAVCQRRSS